MLLGQFGSQLPKCVNLALKPPQTKNLTFRKAYRKVYIFNKWFSKKLCKVCKTTSLKEVPWSNNYKQCNNCTCKFSFRHFDSVWSQFQNIKIWKQNLEFCLSKWQSAVCSAFFKSQQFSEVDWSIGTTLDCPLCQKEFVSNVKSTKALRARVKRHIKEVHLNEKSSQCPHCTETFKRKRDVQKHIKKKHPIDYIWSKPTVE